MIERRHQTTVEGLLGRHPAGAGIGLVLALPKRGLWAIEIKRSLAPRPSKGFWLARRRPPAGRQLVVTPGAERFPLSDGLEPTGLADIMSQLAASS